MAISRLSKLKTLLLRRKQEIFKQSAHLQLGREVHEGHDIEMIDAAQKEEMMRLADHLIERGIEEIKEINIALERMSDGTYGICEICGKKIKSKRLKALPAARLCRECARKYEKVQSLQQHPKDKVIDDDVLNEFRKWLDDDVPPAADRRSTYKKYLNIKNG
ncbi:MAG: TraR/DksA C4-type zinc finger protein [Desulfobacterales bacterium]|jgi:RNA polymerase-binding protein DksA